MACRGGGVVVCLAAVKKENIDAGRYFVVEVAVSMGLSLPQHSVPTRGNSVWSDESHSRAYVVYLSKSAVGTVIVGAVFVGVIVIVFRYCSCVQNERGGDVGVGVVLEGSLSSTRSRIRSGERRTLGSEGMSHRQNIRSRSRHNTAARGSRSRSTHTSTYTDLAMIVLPRRTTVPHTPEAGCTVVCLHTCGGGPPYFWGQAGLVTQLTDRSG